MLGVIGLKSNVKLEIREKLSIIPKHYGRALEGLMEVCEEVLILSTCNRTEIYYNSTKSYEEVIFKIFEKLNWHEDYFKYIFHYEEENAINHIMQVVCGFDSLILGEDQILAQVKESYKIALEHKSIKKDLQKLFQMAITCGKEFRCKTELYKVPVSSASISVSQARRDGAKSFMVLGYGEVGSLACKYIMAGSFEKLYIAVRNTSVVNIDDSRVKVINFNERADYYKYVDSIISCTSAPHTVVYSSELPLKSLSIYDLAVPRDVDEEVNYMENIKLYDIDKISSMNDENCKRREEIMKSNMDIIHKYKQEFYEWRSIKEVSGDILKLKSQGEKVYRSRFETFINKKDTKDSEKLAEVLLKSTSDAYINRAIEVLKEEKLKGRYEECLKLIERIFYQAE
ncbi:glutamyl-tRNA reductase [Clostridium pascui]|uniref:glutamyl-tRNA reductase n=1 Tax=Clostridium pascui TaxID=46609 RepID=UPI00195ABFC7|nr:glutamyl-tRNA reductase [Clostridium pascui]MBM7870837.1 glutamyl-tRNA reductase [Clostridium pascui]